MDPNFHNPNPVVVQVISASPMDAADIIPPSPGKVVTAKLEPPYWRIGLSSLIAFGLGIATVLAWNAARNLHWILAILGLLYGALIVIPLRNGNRVWKSAWVWRVFPGCLCFAGVVWFSLDTNRDIAPLVVLLSLLLVAAVAAGLSNPYEPPQPEARMVPPVDPVLDPNQWTPAQWQAWWQQFIKWNIFRTQRGESVPPLEMPPFALLQPGMPMTARAIHAWQTWYAQYQHWVQLGRSSVPPPPQSSQAEAWNNVTTSFPSGWNALSEAGPFACIICRGSFAGRDIARCPGPETCRSLVCRNCLSRNNNDCPMCGHSQ